MKIHRLIIVRHLHYSHTAFQWPLISSSLLNFAGLFAATEHKNMMLKEEGNHSAAIFPHCWVKTRSSDTPMPMILNRLCEDIHPSIHFWLYIYSLAFTELHLVIKHSSK